MLSFMDKTLTTLNVARRKRRPKSGKEVMLPERYTYWRVGYGDTANYPLEFWIHSAGEYSCKPNYLTGDFHWEHTHQLYYHHTGEAEVILNSTKTSLSSGDILLIPAQTKFRYGGPNISYSWLSIAGHWPKLWGSIQAKQIRLNPDTDLSNKLESIREILIWQKVGYPLQAVGLFYEFMARVEEINNSSTRTQSHYPEKLRRAMNYLVDSSRENFDSVKLSDKATTSASHLRTLFREWLGESPKAFHTRNRMNEACHLLRTQQLRIAQVAHYLGFEDVHHFSRVFKQTIGMSPS